jgi:response regulator RpfG family c-di-GMP phosphodiesterase
MKKKILIADRDASLKDAFRVIFSDDKYEILYAENGKEAERLAAEVRPDIYIVNVNLPKTAGIELYKKLHKEKYLETARFFFMKDENDTTELIGYQAEGVIEKPINFFKVHERISREDDIIELKEVVIEAQEPAVPVMPVMPVMPVEPVMEPKEETVKEETGFKSFMGGEKRDVFEEIRMRPAAGLEEPVMAPVLEEEVKRVLTQVMDEASAKMAERLSPVIGRYVEDYTRRTLLEVAEKIIREEIEKLLKESTA